MQYQQIGDASVLVEGQTEGRLGLSARISMAAYAISVPIHSIDTLHLTIYTIDSIGNAIFCKHSKNEMDLYPSAETTSDFQSK